MKVIIKIYMQGGSQLVKYTVLKEYEDSVLAIPYGYKLLMVECNGKPTLFNKEQIVKWTL